VKLLGLLFALLLAGAVGFGLGLLVSADNWVWPLEIDETDAAGA